MRRYLKALLLIGAVAAAIPASCVTYYFGVELLNQREVAARLRRTHDLDIVRVVGDYDVGVSVLTRDRDGHLFRFGAITDADDVDGERVYLEQIADISLWRVGCHKPMEGLPESNRFFAILGAGLEVGSPACSLVLPPIRGIADVIARGAEVEAALTRLPDCKTWSAQLEASVCRTPASMTQSEIYAALRDHACQREVGPAV